MIQFANQLKMDRDKDYSAMWILGGFNTTCICLTEIVLMAMAVNVPVAVTTTVGAGGLSLSLVVGTQGKMQKKIAYYEQNIVSMIFLKLHSCNVVRKS